MPNGDRCFMPDEVVARNLKPDLKHYLEHKIRTPVLKIFNRLCATDAFEELFERAIAACANRNGNLFRGGVTAMNERKMMEGFFVKSSITKRLLNAATATTTKRKRTGEEEDIDEEQQQQEQEEQQQRQRALPSAWRTPDEQFEMAKRQQKKPKPEKGKGNKGAGKKPPPSDKHQRSTKALFRLMMERVGPKKRDQKTSSSEESDGGGNE